MATFHHQETNLGTTTTWVPLTTQTPFALVCSAAIYHEFGGDFIAFDPYYASVDPTFTTQCIPQEATAWWDQQDQPTTVTSLGPIVCPQAYTTAFQITQNGGSTRVGCCPSGYQYQETSLGPATPRECVSLLTPGQVITYLFAINNGPNWFETSLTVGSQGSSVLGVHINGWNFGTATATLSSITPSSATPSTATPSSTATTPSGSSIVALITPTLTIPSSTGTAIGPVGSSGSLGAGASAGIGVAAAAALIAVTGLVAWMVLSLLSNVLAQLAPLVESRYWRLFVPMRM